MIDKTIHSHSAILNHIPEGREMVTSHTAASPSSISTRDNHAGEAALVSAVDLAKAAREDAQNRLDEAERALDEFYIRRADIAIGCVVEKSGHQFRVASIARYGTRLSVYGNPRLKDGSWGKAHRYVGTAFNIVTKA